MSAASGICLTTGHRRFLQANREMREQKVRGKRELLYILIKSFLRYHADRSTTTHYVRSGRAKWETSVRLIDKGGRRGRWSGKEKEEEEERFPRSRIADRVFEAERGREGEGRGWGKSRREAIRNASISSNLGGIDQFNFVTNSCYNPFACSTRLPTSGARTPPIG